MHFHTSFLNPVLAMYVGQAGLKPSHLGLPSGEIMGAEHRGGLACFTAMAFPFLGYPCVLESHTSHTLPVFTVGVWKTRTVSFRLSVAILRHSSYLCVLVLLVGFVGLSKHVGRCDCGGRSVFALAAVRRAILIVSSDSGLHKMARVDLVRAYDSLLRSYHDQL